ncbi:hypothetical protein FGG08_006297 [Glutinoglossum americanum]|uniref:BTB domain-containing protein n=1 Tax=Glutinoglossum americanum TaxID=1670608 RepID=A0A9P8HWM2_9PEZI|nr:hypothetical protein FGG08_006297 [Glutinoglossum americanum]
MDISSASTPPVMVENKLSSLSLTDDNSPPTPETITLDSSGDVIFLVGGKTPHHQKSQLLLASSKILSLASPVFAAMFRHGFQEGKTLSSRSMDPIPLPDDNPDAIILLFKVLHFRSRDVPWDPDLGTLAHLAVVCDKYDCVEAVAAWSRVWLMGNGGTGSVRGKVEDVVMVLYVSYGLDVPSAFSEASLVLIKDHSRSFELNPELPGSDITAELIPEHLAEDIQRAREGLYSKLDEAIATGIEPLIEMGGLWCVRTRIGSYFTTLSNHNLWPPSALRKTSVQEALKRARAIIEPERGAMPSSVQPIKAALGEALAKTVGGARGMCLDCVKTGGESAREGKCRITHEESKEKGT